MVLRCPVVVSVLCVVTDPACQSNGQPYSDSSPLELDKNWSAFAKNWSAFAKQPTGTPLWILYYRSEEAKFQRYKELCMERFATAFASKISQLFYSLFCLIIIVQRTHIFIELSKSNIWGQSVHLGAHNGVHKSHIFSRVKVQVPYIMQTAVMNLKFEQ
jgi:hypothetical protein